MDNYSIFHDRIYFEDFSGKKQETIHFQFYGNYRFAFYFAFVSKFILPFYKIFEHYSTFKNFESIPNSKPAGLYERWAIHHESPKNQFPKNLYFSTFYNNFSNHYWIRNVCN